MDALDTIDDAVRRIGYRRDAIVRDYPFADVLDPADTTRTVALAAFTQTPPSYRSAALAAIHTTYGSPLTWITAHRSLGAPLLFVIEGDQVTLWQLHGDAPPSVRERLPLADVPALFTRHKDEWHPQAIHRAKAIGAVNREYQLDFVDVGLMPAVEGEVHLKLDRLLEDVLTAAAQVPCDNRPETTLLFRVVFRLLAAKILQDRRHPYAQQWDASNLASILRAIESYYSLPPVPGTGSRTMSPAFAAAWDCLRGGINFSNISSDDLAFVYEHTLVTKDTRDDLGTHSTPRQIAEYAVARLNLDRHDPRDLHIYEPFTGAGTFLVSALRHMRDLLPVDWTDHDRHGFLVDHLSGDETDPFACEVAVLSLILADYPNQNGWRVRRSDLFATNVLKSRMDGGSIVLCNPPFQDFSKDDRSRYAVAKEFYSKPKAVLNTALDAHPRALVFVLPRPFILDRKFAPERAKLERLYGDIELVALPERIFAVSTIESSLLIARDPRPPAAAVVTVQSTEVADHGRITFLKTGQTTTERRVQRAVGTPPDGNLWLPPLPELWHYVQSAPRLSAYFTIHRGIEWKSSQGDAWSDEPQAGYRRGLHNARRARQFALQNAVFLDCRQERLLYKAIDLPWDRAKLVVNAARLRVTSWRIAAMLDRSGLVCSQQFFGLWPTRRLTEAHLLTLAAVLNGPVANAFIATHSPAKGIRISALKEVPLPSTTPLRVDKLVVEYVQCLQASSATEGRLQEILTLIDAAVLEAYDLPPRIEQQLMDFFRGSERPVAHPWQHWDERNPAPGLTLAERVSGRFRPHGSWILDVFQPLPADEAERLRTYGA